MKKQTAFTIDEIIDILGKYNKDIQRREEKYKTLNFEVNDYKTVMSGFEAEKSACYALLCKFTSLAGM